ncbi:serine protease [Photobacterium sp. CAIM 1938]|uniref:trypsin-like serine peptidase n=2 Tax=Photobacterium lucens TaxID=2562949 RepID=UPI00136CE8B8|nr:serine protease [Photobacterium lucens]MBP2699201.1 trypsin-like peptidase domain-containing protein [Vibrio parahaemolyticus]MZG79071.1 serine protease [Photobacterium lucens]
MKQKKYLLVLTTLLTSQAFAIENGKNVLNTQHQTIIQTTTNKCTGNLIAGKWLLTAQHCSGKTLPVISTYEDHRILVEEQINYDDSPYYHNESIDIALWKLSATAPFNQITPLSIKPNYSNQDINIYGYDSNSEQVSKVPLIITSQSNEQTPIVKSVVLKGNGTLVAGDSGAPYINAKNQIVAVHQGIEGELYRGTTIASAKDFILNTVNGWNYPTLISNVKGQKVITLQSLHQDDVIDQAYADGDITLDVAQSTCMQGNIHPFNTCTYVINSQGNEGTLVLSPTEQIIINPDIENNSTGKDNNDKPDPIITDNNGGGGGAFNLSALLSLLFIILFRRKVRH